MRITNIGARPVGEGHPAYIVAEIGINHNGDLDLARQLIDAAAAGRCDAVKFQKRTPDRCVPLSQRNLIRETPWGTMTLATPSSRAATPMCSGPAPPKA